ncbi:MAG: DNA invertase Pin-like site-specific DNA recombinase [Motiliproteus sp.]|jgi:DNA invertase Pin-like site-specific DNA recombinase
MPVNSMRSQKYGYAQVSTLDQDNRIQIEALNKAGCDRIWQEKASGTRRTNREELDKLLSFLREGDTLLITRIDRLARSIKDLQDIIYDLKNRGIHLQATEQPIDTSTAAGKAFLDMLGVFAEFETNLRKERQLEGIAKAKAAGKYKGKAPLSDEKKQQVIELFTQGIRQTAIVICTGLGRTSVHNILKAAGLK